MLDSILSSSALTTSSFLICTAVSLVLGVDEEKFYADCRQVSKKLWDSINSGR